MPKGAVGAIVCGGLAIALLIAMCLIEAFGNAPLSFSGVAAVAAALASLVGLAWSVVSYYERDVFTGIPIAGMIVNGLSVILYAVVFFLGNT